MVVHRLGWTKFKRRTHRRQILGLYLLGGDHHDHRRLRRFRYVFHTMARWQDGPCLDGLLCVPRCVSNGCCFVCCVCHVFVCCGGVSSGVMLLCRCVVMWFRSSVIFPSVIFYVWWCFLLQCPRRCRKSSFARLSLWPVPRCLGTWSGTSRPWWVPSTWVKNWRRICCRKFEII